MSCTLISYSYTISCIWHSLFLLSALLCFLYSSYKFWKLYFAFLFLCCQLYFALFIPILPAVLCFLYSYTISCTLLSLFLYCLLYIIAVFCTFYIPSICWILSIFLKSAMYFAFYIPPVICIVCFLYSASTVYCQLCTLYQWDKWCLTCAKPILICHWSILNP